MPPKRKSAPAASSSSNPKSNPKSKANPQKKPRLTLDAFFSPKVPVYANAGINSFSGGGGGGGEDRGKEGERGTGKEREREKVCEVVLSDEQRGVLRMVVEEERSVFFTGSAGEFLSFLSFVLGLWIAFWSYGWVCDDSVRRLCCGGCKLEPSTSGRWQADMMLLMDGIVRLVSSTSLCHRH